MGFSLTSLWVFSRSIFRAFWLDRPLKHRDVRTVVMRQIFYTGTQALKLICLCAVGVGVLTVSQSASQLQRFGGGDAIGPILVAAIVRELAPLFTVLIVTARSVTAVASELSSMKANGEIDALRGCGVSPLSYLIVPRVIGGAIATWVLSMHFVWVALLAGFIAAQFFVDVGFSKFLISLTSSLSIGDLSIFFLKTFILGIVVFLVASFSGMRTTGASFEVPVATTRAVVWSFMTVLSFQIVVSALYYLYYFKNTGIGGLL